MAELIDASVWYVPFLSITLLAGMAHVGLGLAAAMGKRAGMLLWLAPLSLTVCVGLLLVGDVASKPVEAFAIDERLRLVAQGVAELLNAQTLAAMVLTGLSSLCVAALGAGLAVGGRDSSDWRPGPAAAIVVSFVLAQVAGMATAELGKLMLIAPAWALALCGVTAFVARDPGTDAVAVRARFLMSAVLLILAVAAAEMVRQLHVIEVFETLEKFGPERRAELFGKGLRLANQDAMQRMVTYVSLSSFWSLMLIWPARRELRSHLIPAVATIAAVLILFGLVSAFALSHTVALWELFHRGIAPR